MDNENKNIDMSNNANLEVNKKNSDYYNQLMKDAGSNKDMYYDKNNPFVKIFLLILFAIIVIGSAIVLLIGV